MQQLLVPRRCFSVNIISKVMFNSLCLLWKQRTYGRGWWIFERRISPSRFSTRHWWHSFNVARVRFHRSVQALYHTWPRTAFNGPSLRMATHRHGKYIRNTSNTLWRKIDTCRTGRKTEKEIEGGRERESRATTPLLSVIGGRDLLYWIHGEVYLYRNDEGGKGGAGGGELIERRFRSSPRAIRFTLAISRWEIYRYVYMYNIYEPNSLCKEREIAFNSSYRSRAIFCVALTLRVFSSNVIDIREDFRCFDDAMFRIHGVSPHIDRLPHSIGHY